MNATNNNTQTSFQMFSSFSQCPYKRHIEEIINFSFQDLTISLFMIIILYQQFFYGYRVQKIENILEEGGDSMEEDDTDEDEKEDHEEDLHELFTAFQETIENNFKSLNKKLKTLQDNLTRIENDLNDDNKENKQKFKLIDKKLSKLNEKYSSLEVIVDELNDTDDTDSDSDYEEENEKRNAGSIRIQNYSDKSFVVYGDTKEFKEVLKKLGGKWNRNLSDGPGWIFPNNYRDDVNKWFHSHFDEDL